MVHEGAGDYIFVSYSHQDSATVLPIVRGMQDRGFRIWYDPGIEEGVDWSEYIAQQLDGCRVFISFMSEGAASSTYCRQEIHRAIDKKKSILVAYLETFRLSPGLEMMLAHLQAVYRQSFGSEREFFESLCNVGILQSCRDEELAKQGSSNLSDDEILDVFIEELMVEAGFEAPTEEMRRDVHLELKNKLVAEIERSLVGELPDEILEELNSKIAADGTLDPAVVVQAIANAHLDTVEIVGVTMARFRSLVLGLI